jgi:hypothetical protein
MNERLAATTVRTAARTLSPGNVRFETHGGALANVLRCSDAISEVARSEARTVGLLPEDAHAPSVIPEWFPLEQNLAILRRVGESLGDEALFAIGASVPKHATFPPGLTDLERALASLDVAFHMNHRRDGMPMYDPGSGSFLEGIGHYRFYRQDAMTLVVESSSVYPCDFDHGLITGLVARFAPGGRTDHSPGRNCRNRADTSCSYQVTG